MLIKNFKFQDCVDITWKATAKGTTSDIPKVRGLGPLEIPYGVRNASKSDREVDVEIGIIGGVVEGGRSADFTSPEAFESLRDSLRRVSAGAGLGEPRGLVAGAPILDGGRGNAISEFVIRSRWIWLGFTLGGNAGCCSVLKSPMMSCTSENRKKMVKTNLCIAKVRKKIFTKRKRNSGKSEYLS